MNRFYCIILLGLLFAATVPAEEFYYWTDENGIKKFSQNPPPEQQADSVEKVSEIPYDQETDAKRMKEDENWRKEAHQEAEKSAAERKVKQKAEQEAAKHEEERAKAEKKKQEVVVIKKKKKKVRIYVKPDGTLQSGPKPKQLPAAPSPK